MPKEEEFSEFTVFPPETTFFPPFEGHVTILFPTNDDAIVFYEFLKSFIYGDVDWELTERKK